jgi:ABC-2 type transport system permease protein
MVGDTGRLLKLYWLLDQRETLKLSRPARILQIFVFVLIGGLSALVGYGAGLAVRSPDLPVRIDPGLVPGFILTFLLLATVLFGTNQALRALFLSGDLDRLLATPVSTRAVMTAKLLSRLPSTVLILFLIAFPAIIAFGIGLQLGPLYYLFGLLLVLVSPLFGLAVGALLSMVLVRFIPTQRLNEYLGAASIFIGILFMVVFQLPNLMRGRIEAAATDGAETAAAVQGALETAGGIPLPSIQAGQGLVSLGQGRILEGIGGVGFFLLLTAGLFFGVVLLADRLYLTGWLRVQGSGARRNVPIGGIGRSGVFSGRSVDASIAVKDWLLRIREPRHLMQMAIQIVALSIMLFVIIRPGGAGEQDLMTILRGGPPDALPRFLGALFSPGMFISGTIVFAVWAFFSYLGLTALALEQRSFYVLKVAPVSPTSILRAKTMSVALPAAVVATVLFIGNWFVFRFSLGWSPYGWLSILIISTMVLATATAIGILYPRLDWEDPRRMTTQRGGLYSFIGIIILVIPALLVAAGAFLLGTLFPQAAVVFMLLGLLAQGVYAFAVWRILVGRIEQAWPQLGVD